MANGEEVFHVERNTEVKLVQQEKGQLTVFKKMASVHLPQYLANLTQPIGTKKAVCFGEIYPCTGRSQDFSWGGAYFNKRDQIF